MPITWYDTCRYLGVYLTCAKKFQANFDHTQSNFYWSFNGIMAKVGSSASNDVMVQLRISIQRIFIRRIGIRRMRIRRFDIRRIGIRRIDIRLIGIQRVGFRLFGIQRIGIRQIHIR